MRDIDIITKAMGDAHAVLHGYVNRLQHGYLEPDPRNAEATLQQMFDILDRDDVVAARERISNGYGHLSVVK
ncbi:hypothetical protein AB8B21_03385 [Tardiphaga sp. 866_E4_N2_1]|uniref:hypothetical protein n=1 Tax=unclassified Tardiphaga TaxID=2631404 RepID=UPI003F24F065